MKKSEKQAFDTEKFYRCLGVRQLEEYSVKTGLNNGKENLDARLLLSIFLATHPSRLSMLEVGCGNGRIGQFLMQQPKVEYWGIELHKPFTDDFKSKVQDKSRVLEGDFLDYKFPFEKVGCVLFPWSVIGDFSSGIGQIAALRRAKDILFDEGRILIDIPKDIVNAFEGYEPGYFNVHERYNLMETDLEHVRSHTYTTFTGRNREIIEIVRKYRKSNASGS